MKTLVDVLHYWLNDKIQDIADESFYLTMESKQETQDEKTQKELIYKVEDFIKICKDLKKTAQFSSHHNKSELTYFDIDYEKEYSYSEFPLIDRTERSLYSRSFTSPLKVVSDNKKTLFTIYGPSFVEVLLLKTISKEIQHNMAHYIRFYRQRMMRFQKRDLSESWTDLDDAEIKYFKALFKNKCTNDLSNLSKKQFFEQLSLEQILDITCAHIFNIKTLKIISTDILDNNDLENSATSFLFVLAYQKNIPFLISKSVNEFLGKRNYISRRTVNDELEPPRRIYKKNLVELYCLALSSENSFVKYIDYYHILEYFFSELFINHVSNKVYNIITSPDFSYNNDKDMYDLAKKTGDLIRIGKSSNEYESLELVLKKFIPSCEEFKKSLTSKNEGDEYKYASSSPSFLSKKLVIQWTDRNFYQSLTKRIYSVRNALVHAKSLEDTYRQEDEEELEKEVQLIKTTAEYVIKNSTKKPN